MLAVMESDGTMPFGQMLAEETVRLGRSATLVLITPSPDPQWVHFAQDARRRGLHLIVVFVDPSSFGYQGDVGAIIGEVAASAITTYVVRQGDDLRQALGGERSKLAA
jgi:hypothetical protein